MIQHPLAHQGNPTYASTPYEINWNIPVSYVYVIYYIHTVCTVVLYASYICNILHTYVQWFCMLATYVIYYIHMYSSSVC